MVCLVFELVQCISVSRHTRYPFHLRPKNGQLVRFLRIATDLIRDLQLDEDFLTMPDPLSREVTDDELEKIRTYLAYLYLIST